MIHQTRKQVQQSVFRDPLARGVWSLSPRPLFPTISQDIAEAVFVQIAEFSNVPEVPPNTGFTILEHSPVYDIVVKASLESSEDVDIGDNLDASVEICLPVPENNSRAVLVHYARAGPGKGCRHSG